MMVTLNFDLGETHDMLRDTIRAFATEEIAPRAADVDHQNVFPADLWRKFGDLGLLGITVEEEYGGAGLGHPAPVIAGGENSPASPPVGPPPRAPSDLLGHPNRPHRTPGQKSQKPTQPGSGGHGGAA